MSEPKKKMVFMAILSENETDEFLTNPERKKCKNTQNIIARWMLSTF